MPFRSRRRGSRRSGPKSRMSRGRSTRRTTRGRRGLRSQAIRDYKCVTREFLWGSISVVSGATPTPTIVTPAQTVPFVPATGVANGWQLGVNHLFHLTDMPASFVTYAREFDYFKIKGITLKFKPRWDNVNMGTAATLTGPLSAPRVYAHSQHDQTRINSEIPTSGDDIMRYPTHTIYDLTKQRMYHLKPNTMVATATGSTDIVPYSFTPGYNKWQSTVSNGDVFTDPTYFGIQTWMEWQNPPLTNTTPGNNDSVIDIYATYTVCMKEHHE